MSWFLRLTRFASAHLVRSQDLDCSCAMASIVMVNFKMKKGLIAAGVKTGLAMQAVPVVGSTVGITMMKTMIAEAVKSEPEVYKLYEDVSGDKGHDFKTAGADRTQYYKVMEKLGLGQWEAVDMPQGDVAQAIVDATGKGAPVILSIAWDGGGGHAVVCDETHTVNGQLYLCICDPWDGELRVTKATVGSAIVYKADEKPWSFNFGGDAHDYQPGDTGKVRGWIMRRKQ